MNRLIALSIPIIAVAGLAGSAPAQDATDPGQILFNNACRTCHSVKDADNRLGPHLHGMVELRSGALKNYAYSDSMAKPDLVWDKATLDRFIADPQAVV